MLVGTQRLRQCPNGIQGASAVCFNEIPLEPGILCKEGRHYSVSRAYGRNDPLYTNFCCLAEKVADERTATDLKHWLWDFDAASTQTCSLPACHEPSAGKHITPKNMVRDASVSRYRAGYRSQVVSWSRLRNFVGHDR